MYYRWCENVGCTVRCCNRPHDIAAACARQQRQKRSIRQCQQSSLLLSAGCTKATIIVCSASFCGDDVNCITGLSTSGCITIVYGVATGNRRYMSTVTMFIMRNVKYSTSF